MERNLVWHIRAIAWIAVVVGVAMVATNIEAAGQIVAGAGFAAVLLTYFRPKPARPAPPVGPERPSGANETP